MSKIEHYVNHIVLVVDASGSMQGKPVVQVFDKEIEYLKQRSLELDQEVRVSIYTFNSKTTCLVYDMDVMRMKTLAGKWQASGQTALCDATAKSISDAKLIPQIYDDHAFLVYVITDGQENASADRDGRHLRSMMDSMPDHWTFACLVPDARGVADAKRYGFHADSISVWDTTKANAFESVGSQFSKTVDNYMQMRASGIRGTKSLFKLDPSNIRTASLTKLPATRYGVYSPVPNSTVKGFYEVITGQAYRPGTVYYTPTKRIKLQDYKDILVQDVKTGDIYEGDVRRQLGLPDDTVYVEPTANPKFRIFVQSTSLNRKLLSGQLALIKW